MSPSGTSEMLASHQGPSTSARLLRGEVSHALDQTLPSTPAAAVFAQQSAVVSTPSPLGGEESLTAQQMPPSGTLEILAPHQGL